MAPQDQVPTNGNYNYDHFSPAELTGEVRDYPSRAPNPGDEAPGFSLRDTAGREWRLEDLRDQPVVLITGSASCPMTRGSMRALKAVHEDLSGAMHWFTLYVREAHPGEKLPRHESYEQKVEHAEFLQRADRVPWPILVDDLEGTVHAAYGKMPNAVYLIGTDGRISFREKIAHAPTLRRALDELTAAGGQGTVLGGDDRRVHMLAATIYGWRAIERAGQEAIRDVATKAPPLAANLWLGQKLSPAFDPLARRSTPLPLAVRAGATAVVAALAGIGVWSLIRSLRR
jgi:hypothetical protein